MTDSEVTARVREITHPENDHSRDRAALAAAHYRERQTASVLKGAAKLIELLEAELAVAIQQRDALRAACEAAYSLLRKLGGANHDPEFTMLGAAIAKAKEN